MKKIFLPVALLIVLITGMTSAQNFTLTCDTLVRHGSPGSFFVFYPQLTNLSGQDLQIRIARRMNLLPTNNWQSSICYGYCYPSNVDSIDDVMPYPFTGIDFTLDVQSDPSVPGTAVITLAVVNKANPNEFQQLTFTASTLPISVRNEEAVAPHRFLLYNYPNPFNPSTTIEYEIPLAWSGRAVDISIYNPLGQKVRTLYQGTPTAGKYQLRWNGKDDHQNSLPGGLYLYRLSAGKQSVTKKMLLLK